MGYSKFIKFGNNVELYEYEKDLVVLRAGRHHVADKEKIDPDADLTEVEVGKRKDNAHRASTEFRRLVSSNLDDKVLPLLATITYKENLTDLKKSYYDYKLFIQKLHYTYGKELKYIAVPEFQERGAVHFHVLFWGLPAEKLLPERLTDRYENVSPTLGTMWGNGFVFLKETDGNDKLSSYLAKYMSKAFTDPRLKHQKEYVTSRKINRPYVASGSFPMCPLLDDYVGLNPVAVKDKTYDTKYLGKGRYRLFKIKE